MAINRVWYDDAKQKQEETTFVDITLWGRQAEIAAQYLTKGSSAYIEGRLTLDTWEDKATGTKRSKLKIVGETLQLIGGKRDGGSASNAREDREAPRSSREPVTTGPPDDSSNSEDDIPF